MESTSYAELQRMINLVSLDLKELEVMLFADDCQKLRDVAQRVLEKQDLSEKEIRHLLKWFVKISYNTSCYMNHLEAKSATLLEECRMLYNNLLQFHMPEAEINQEIENYKNEAAEAQKLTLTYQAAYKAVKEQLDTLKKSLESYFYLEASLSERDRRLEERERLLSEREQRIVEKEEQYEVFQRLVETETTFKKVRRMPKLTFEERSDLLKKDNIKDEEVIAKYHENGDSITASMVEYFNTDGRKMTYLGLYKRLDRLGVLKKRAQKSEDEHKEA